MDWMEIILIYDKFLNLGIYDRLCSCKMKFFPSISKYEYSYQIVYLVLFLPMQ